MNRTRVIFWLKVFVALLLAVFLYVQLVVKNDVAQLLQVFRHSLSATAVWQLLLVVVLMPVNWLLETAKWQGLLQRSAEHFGKSFRAVLAGVTFGFISPGRSGEFIGRMLYLHDSHKPRIFFLSLIGGLAQTAVTLVAGTFILISLGYNTVIIGMASGLTVAFLLAYFRFEGMARLYNTVPFVQRRQLHFDEEHQPAQPILWQVFLLSAIRYGVYLLQYSIAFHALGVSDNATQLALASGLILLLQSFSFLMPFIDISYRGAIALYAFAGATENHLAVLATVFFIWCINLALPALAGYLFILKKKF